MTTIVDPLGTPSVIYNKSGMAIVSLTANATPPAAVIPRVCGHMVVLVTPTEEFSRVQLPAGAEIGDAVEIHIRQEVPGFQNMIHIDGQPGDTFPLGSAVVSGGSGVTFRKTTATLWSNVGSFT